MMRLPWGPLSEVSKVFLDGSQFSVLGCLSFEERSRTVPMWAASKRCQHVHLLEIDDPEDAFPNFSEEAKARRELNRIQLVENGVTFTNRVVGLLASEDEILEELKRLQALCPPVTVILDITSLPKRYFCLILKRLIMNPQYTKVIVVYTLAGMNGYTHDHLAEDPMPSESLPGFSAPFSPKGDALVMSIGYEPLRVASLFEVYRDKRKATKFLMTFPPNGISMRREWNTLRQIVSDKPSDVNREDIKVVAAWDSEEVYRTLESWQQDTSGLTLAPFGPKPHTLAMALFAIKHECGLFYTQPKSYNPNYSHGATESWAYVVKWEGVPCYERPMNPI